MIFRHSLHHHWIFIVVFALWIGCLFPLWLSPSGKPQQESKTINFSIQYSFNGNCDPVEMNYINLQFLFHSIYSTPFKLDTHLRIKPAVVNRYEQKGKNVIFYIRKDAKFSDGTPITAMDVIHSIEAGITHPNFPNPVYKLIEGGEELFAGKTPNCTGIKSLGPKSLEIRLKDEHTDFESYFTANTMSILPQHRNQDRKPKNMVFSGPYQLVDYQNKTNQSVVTLKRNPYYFGNSGNLDTILLHFYSERLAFERSIELGIPDLFLYSQGLKFPTSSYKYNYFKTPSFGAFYIKLNPIKGPFKDKKLRTFLKNLILSLDLVEKEKWELTAPCKMVLPYSLTGYFVFDTMTPENDFKKLMPKQNIKISCLNPNYGIRKTLLPRLKKKLKKYNLDLQLEWTNKLENVQTRERSQDFDLTTYYYLVDIPLSSFFYETLFTPGHELNLFGYIVPKAMKLLAEYRKENDELKKLKVLSQLEALAQEEAFLIPLMNPLYILGYKHPIKNVKINKFLQINFEGIDVE